MPHVLHEERMQVLSAGSTSSKHTSKDRHATPTGCRFFRESDSGQK